MAKNNQHTKPKFMSTNDFLLPGITYDELITTVNANCGSEATVENILREYENILQANIEDARHLLKSKGLEFVCSELGIKTENR